MAIARFHVFSGTGNSRRIGNELAASFAAAGFAIEIREVSNVETERMRRGEARIPVRAVDDLDLFLFPVYAMSLPRIMEKYMKSLGRVASPRSGRAGSSAARPRAAILSANGRISTKVRDGHEGRSLVQAEGVLSRRGWDVVYRETFDYPQNVTSMGTAQNDAVRAEIMGQMEPRIEAAAADLIAGRRWKRPCSFIINALAWPFGWLYRVFGRRAWGMFFAADEHCDGCGLCVSRCPAAAITMRGGIPDWSYACEGCERCMNLCPKKAIQGSTLRMALVAALSVAMAVSPPPQVLANALAFLPRAAVEAGWIAMGAILCFTLLRLIDLGLVTVSRLRFLRSVLAFGWTRWMRRYPDPSREAPRARPSHSTSAPAPSPVRP